MKENIKSKNLLNSKINFIIPTAIIAPGIEYPRITVLIILLIKKIGLILIEYNKKIDIILQIKDEKKDNKKLVNIRSKKLLLITLCIVSKDQQNSWKNGSINPIKTGKKQNKTAKIFWKKLKLYLKIDLLLKIIVYFA